MRLWVLLLFFCFLYDASLVWAKESRVQQQSEQGEEDENSNLDVDDAMEKSAAHRSIVKLNNFRQLTATGILLAYDRIISPKITALEDMALLLKYRGATSKAVACLYPEGLVIRKVIDLVHTHTSLGRPLVYSGIRKAGTILGKATGVAVGVGLSLMITALTAGNKEQLILDIMVTVISEVIAFALTEAIIAGISVGCVNPPAGLALFAMELVLNTVISTATTAILYACLNAEDF